MSILVFEPQYEESVPQLAKCKSFGLCRPHYAFRSRTVQDSTRLCKLVLAVYTNYAVFVLELFNFVVLIIFGQPSGTSVMELYEFECLQCFLRLDFLCLWITDSVFFKPTEVTSVFRLEQITILPDLGYNCWCCFLQRLHGPLLRHTEFQRAMR